MIPKRKPAKGKLGTRQDAGPMRCGSYLQWVRGHVCWACGAVEGIEAAHYRGADVPDEDRGGMGQKPADRWTVPLCGMCHQRQHQLGHASFDLLTGRSMRHAAAEMWHRWLRTTPAGKRWRAEHGD